MASYSTREAAKLLGVSMATINRYIVAGTIPVPPLTRVGGVTVRLWKDKDIFKAKAIVDGFTDGRRTRHREPKRARGRAR
ncbi:MAG: hypothetical protein LAO76_10980 [Acidobacteriia bacterium]|nr:hypothetical protein [Terriglobia bacterium]